MTYATFAEPRTANLIAEPQVYVESGAIGYDWIENWATIPETESGRIDGRTHGAAVSESGQVIVFNQATPAVLFYDQNGQLQAGWGNRFPGAHGLTLVKEDGTEYLWLADSTTAEVVKTTLDGRTVMTLEQPNLPIYQNNPYKPTWVAVDEARFGGSGDIWVTDGYGQNYIHRYNRYGIYLGSIDGSEGEAGAFKCPHGIWIDRRNGVAKLYVADRGNHRIQVFDMAGQFKRVFGSEVLTSPCCFTVSGDYLVVPELKARLAIFDRNDQLVGYLGENEEVCDIKGWPNHPAELIEPGKFNSPHGITADEAGNLYVVEWIVGGRITKLAPIK